ncbi:MAG TPA: S53 family peptidase [Bryobacteraceae bacterium]|nr:S53 family peptidase [Bryobacteraceae bacterium]
MHLSTHMHFSNLSQLAICCGILLAGVRLAGAQGAGHVFTSPPVHVYGQFTDPIGIAPAQMRKAYGFSAVANQGAGQTIAIVDAFDDPNLESDLAVFTTQFSLPACTTANGCFEKIYASGTQPKGATNWGLEQSLDVEWAHAIAPQAKILLVEAATNNSSDLFHAVDVAVANGASVVSMSWGGPEYAGELLDDIHFNSAHVTFLASSGDSGHGVEYPAASPHVIGVGGTSLYLWNGTYLGELAWSGSGGGLSAYEAKPVYQQNLMPLALLLGKTRGVPDVAYDSDPATGVPVYDTYGYSGWIEVGGTSAAAPQWAALIAIVDAVRALAGKSPLSAASVLPAIYSSAYGANLHDITLGSNGGCGPVCFAKKQYDFITGEGSPRADSLIPALALLP